MVEKRKEEPIYEKLGLDECMLLSRDDEGVLFACNEKGNVILKRVPYPTLKELAE
jgi:hypothetical protein